MDYPMCDRAVTRYRKTPDGVTRQVLTGCYYQWQLRQTEKAGIRHQETTFLLIVPGAGADLQVGDRVLEGIGPEQVDWDSFLPVSVPGLGQVDYVRPWYWQGRLCHTEAGRK